MNVAIYARVSTTDQNCSIQLTELRQYATSRGWTVSPEAEYVDAGVSGKKASRPALDLLMKSALGRKVDIILVYKLDRWGRSVVHLADSIAQLRTAGVRLIATSQGIDTDKDNPTSSLMLHILAAVAQFEREMILERTAMGWAKYKTDFEAGKAVTSRSGRNLPIGRPKSVFDRHGVCELRAAGKSWAEIAAATGVSKSAARRAVESLSA